MTDGQKFRVGAEAIFLGFCIAFLYMVNTQAQGIFDFRWVQAWPGIKDVRYIGTDQRTVNEKCTAAAIARGAPRPDIGPDYFRACAVRDFTISPPVCIIYGPPNPPDWLMDHEKRQHCEQGLDHPPWK